MSAFLRIVLSRWITIAFCLFILIVVILADLGLVGKVFGWLYNYPNGDKGGHFFLMGTLAMLASLTFPLRRVHLFRIGLLQSSLVIAGLVILEEASQLLFPERTASFLDLVASLAGIFLLGEFGAFLKQKINPI